MEAPRQFSRHSKGSIRSLVSRHARSHLSSPNGTDSAEIVVDLYKGTETDVDVGFWNIEWFSNRFNTKTKDVATIIADFNLDIWALSKSSSAATQELVDTLQKQFKLDYAVAHSEPDAGTGKQSTSVLWNTRTVDGKRLDLAG